MTKAKSKTKKIILLVIAALAAAALIGVGLYLFLPGSWRSLDSFSQYEGLLDEPLAEITISRGMEEITFSAKDGSRLIFQAVRRTDSLSLDDMTDRICSSELERMSSSEVILNHVNDNYGKVMVTGWDNESDG